MLGDLRRISWGKSEDEQILSFPTQLIRPFYLQPSHPSPKKQKRRNANIHGTQKKYYSFSTDIAEILGALGTTLTCPVGIIRGALHKVGCFNQWTAAAVQQMHHERLFVLLTKCHSFKKPFKDILNATVTICCLCSINEAHLERQKMTRRKEREGEIIPPAYQISSSFQLAYR